MSVEVGGLVVRLLDLVTAIGIAVAVGVDTDADADAGFFESLLSVMGSLLAFPPMTAIETATETVVAVTVFRKVQMDSNLFDSFRTIVLGML